METQWYPGHMAKAKRLLEENLKMVNVVIEICDARLPFSSRNPDIDRIIGNKPRLLVLNKSDLSDPKWNEYWSDYYRQKGFNVLFTNSKSGDGVKNVVKAVKDIMNEKAKKNAEKGRISTTVYTMVVGIPNVGKSSFINRSSGKAVAVTGDRPGVTRDKQWLKIDESFYLLDTPGMLWPRIENQIAALKLAASGAIKDEVCDLGELAAFLLTFVEENYPGIIDRRFGIDLSEIQNDDDEMLFVTESIIGAEKLKRGLAILEACGRKRGCLLKGGIVDIDRASAVVLDEFRAGKFGNLSLDFDNVFEEDKRLKDELHEKEKAKEQHRIERKKKYNQRKGH